MTLLDCHPSNPLRRPHWRWEQARLLLDGRLRANRRRDDAWVLRARRFQRVMDEVGGDPGHPRLARLDRDVQGAYRLRCAADARPRWEVEARLVAGQAAAAIADRLGVAAGVAEAYAALYYAVADRLEALDWVAAVVFGPRRYDGLMAEDVDILAKIIAYNLGPPALDAFVAWLGWPGVARPRPMPSVGARLGRSLALLVAALTLRVDEASAPALLRLADRLREFEGAAAAGAAAAGSAAPVFAPIALPTDAFFMPMPVVTAAPTAAAGPPDRPRRGRSCRTGCRRRCGPRGPRLDPEPRPGRRRHPPLAADGLSPGCGPRGGKPARPASAGRRRRGRIDPVAGGPATPGRARRRARPGG